MPSGLGTRVALCGSGHAQETTQGQEFDHWCTPLFSESEKSIGPRASGSDNTNVAIWTRELGGLDDVLRDDVPGPLVLPFLVPGRVRADRKSEDRGNGREEPKQLKITIHGLIPFYVIHFSPLPARGQLSQRAIGPHLLSVLCTRRSRYRWGNGLLVCFGVRAGIPSGY
jgi:hypothetical protein